MTKPINRFFGVGDKLKRIRTGLGMNQIEFSKMIGISRSTYSNYENNNRVPNEKVLRQMAEALDIPFIEFLGIKQTIALDDLGSEKKYCAPIVKITEISDQLHIAPKLLLDDEYSNDFAAYLTAYFYLEEIYPGISSDLREFKELIYDWETNNELQESDPFAKNVHEIVTLKEKPHLIELNKLFEKHKDLDPKIKRDIEWLLEKNVRLYEEIINTLRESLRYLILE